MRFETSLFILALALSGQAGAQSPDPARPDAKAPEIAYESVFKSYRAYEEPELASWTELNEAVAKAGGHVGIFAGEGHARHGAAPAPGQADQPKPSSSAPSKPDAQGPAGGHAGH